MPNVGKECKIKNPPESKNSFLKSVTLTNLWQMWGKSIKQKTPESKKKLYEIRSNSGTATQKHPKKVKSESTRER